MTVLIPNISTPAAAEKTRLLLADLWRRNRPIIEERLATLDRAADHASVSYPLPDDLHAAALDVAHKLSGSVGMFGFEQGTLLSRELEQLLSLPRPNAARLAELAKQLREVLLPAS